MAFYAGQAHRRTRRWQNPTLVVLTDRNDLDDQLFGTFAALPRAAPADARPGREPRPICASCSRSPPAASSSRPSRSSCPRRRARRIPLLSDRRNIVVIADEAHRSQYDFIDGFAQHLRDALPNASFIGFTGTPIELTDKNTQRRLRRLHRHLRHPAGRRGRRHRADLLRRPPRQARAWTRTERPKIDAEFEEVTEGEEVDQQEKLKSKWAAWRRWSATEKRVELIAKDLVEHFEQRLRPRWTARRMIVCMSRRICVDLYDAIVKLRPEWHERRRRRRRAHQGRHDRLGLGRARLAAAHPQQAAPRGAGEALQGPRRPASSWSSCATCG